MSEATNTTGHFREHWLNPRRKRFWSVVVVLLYTLFGFFLAPLLIKNTIVDLIQEDLGRAASIDKVKVNPYVLSLEIQGFEVLDKDNVKLTSFDGFFVNFQLSSLFKWAWEFKEVRLDAPYFHIERFKSGETRLEHLLTDIEAAFPPDPEKPVGQKAPTAPRLMVQNLSINNAQVEATDHVPDRVVAVDLSPININVHELNTLPDIFGEQTVEIVLPDDGVLSWSGSLELWPFHSEGKLSLKNLKFDRSIAYLESMLPLKVVGGRFYSQFKYRVAMDDELGITLQVDDLQAQLDEVLVSGLSPTAEFVNIPQIDFSGGRIRYPERDLKFAKIEVQEPVLTAWRNQDGSISFMDLVPDKSESAPADDADAAPSAWSLTIDEVSVERGNIALTDNSVDPATELALTDLAIKATQVSNAAGANIPLELTGNLQQGGSYTFNGELKVLPAFSMTATATTTQIPLVLAQTYVKPFARVEIKDGKLDSSIKIELPELDNLTATGRLKISALEINDSIENQKLLGWTLLDIDQFEFSGDKVHFSQLDLTRPFGRFVVNKDRSTNVAAIVVEQPPATVATIAGPAIAGQATAGSAPSEPATAVQPLVVIIGGIKVDDGAMNFADFSLPLPFSTHIAALNGNISTIATDSEAPANIKLEGQVNEYGLARIDGSMNVFDPIKQVDVKVEFRNLQMADLSPYTVEFAGREIDEGKLSLDLVYKITEGQMDGTNAIVLSDLVLGKKVDSPDAASLPLDLAVALLTDSDGVIKVDLPVQGDINDPEFKIGGMVWKAIASLITKIVTAPFRFLGNLIGVDSEDLGQFEFLAGRADLTPPELEKVAQLQRALQKRPELAVEIAGVSDSKIDVPALKKIRLRQTLKDRLGEGVVSNEDQRAMMLDVRIRNMVEVMFKERFPEVPTESLKETYKAPPKDDPEGEPKLDELAYATQLWNQMLEAEPVTDQNLSELAAARAAVIKDAFLASGEFDAKRVIIAEPKQVTSDDGQWVVLELGVATD